MMNPTYAYQSPKKRNVAAAELMSPWASPNVNLPWPKVLSQNAINSPALFKKRRLEVSTYLEQIERFEECEFKTQKLALQEEFKDALNADEVVRSYVRWFSFEEDLISFDGQAVVGAVIMSFLPATETFHRTLHPGGLNAIE